MYKIEKNTYGFKLTFAGVIDKNEMSQWLEESKITLQEVQGTSFGVIVDMRTLVPLSIDARPVMEEGQELYKNTGMRRSLVVVQDRKTLLQFEAIARESGIYDWERYVSEEDTPNWDQVGLDWIEKGLDPNL